MNKKSFIFVIIIFSFISFVFAKPKLCSVSSGIIHSGDYGNNPVQIITTDDGLQVSVSSEFSSNGKYVKYYFNIQNKSNKPYYFDENSIIAYEGNYETNEWYNLPYKPAKKFLQERRDDYVLGSVVLGAVTLGALLFSDSDDYDEDIIDVGLDIAVDLYNYASPITVVTPTVNVYMYDPDPVLTGLALASLFCLMDLTDDINSLEYLEHSLLFSNTIGPNEQYTGVVFVPEGKGPDYKVSFQVSPNETYDFKFARSDRESILNPWADKSSMFAILFGANVPGFNTFSLYTLFSGDFFGGYAGGSFSFGNTSLPNVYGSVKNGEYNNVILNSNAPSGGYYKFIPSDKSREDTVSFYGGITLKVIPHTYLMGGVGMEIDNSIKYGNFVSSSSGGSGSSDNFSGWAKIDPSIYCVPQVGVNVSFGVIDFATIYEFVINKGFKFNVLLGLSF